MAAYLDIYNIYNIYNDICSSYDPHWALYTDHCAPCLADFTHIVRLDEDSELPALLATTGLAALLEDGGSLVTNPTSGGSSASVVRTYMEMLECEEVELDIHTISTISTGGAAGLHLHPRPRHLPVQHENRAAALHGRLRCHLRSGELINFNVDK